MSRYENEPVDFTSEFQDSDDEWDTIVSDVFTHGFVDGEAIKEIVVDNINNDPPIADEGEIPTATGKVKEGARSLKELKGVLTLESIIYKLYFDDMRSDMWKEMARCLETYESWETKPVTGKLATKIARGLRACEEKKITKEEAKLLIEASSKVDNNVYAKIESFLAQKKGQIAVIDVQEKTMKWIAGHGLEDFLQNRLEDGLRMFPRKMLANYISMVSSMQGFKDPNRPDYLARMSDGKFFFNCLINDMEREGIETFLEKSVRNFDPAKAALTNAKSFAYKVAGRYPKEYIEVISPQIMERILPHLAGDHERIVQVVLTSRKDKGPREEEGGSVRTIFVSEDGDPGDRNSVILTKDDWLIDPSSRPPMKESAKRAFKVIIETGVATNKSGLLHILAKWDSPLTESELLSAKMIGVVKPAMYSTLYARVRKEGSYLDRSEKWWSDTYASYLICPVSQAIIMIPKKFLKVDSAMRFPGNVMGFQVSKGLIKNLNTFSAGFSIGLIKSKDWDALTSEEVLMSRDLFGGNKFSFGARYVGFVNDMVEWLNSIRSMVVVYPGSKKDIDPDVIEYLGEENWDVGDNGEGGVEAVEKELVIPQVEF